LVAYFRLENGWKGTILLCRVNEIVRTPNLSGIELFGSYTDAKGRF